MQTRFTEAELSAKTTLALSHSFMQDVFVTFSGGKCYIETDSAYVINHMREYINKDKVNFPNGCTDIMDGLKVTGLMHDINEIQKGLLIADVEA